MARPSQIQTEDTRRRIIETAQRLIQTRGFNGFSFRDVAAEVGIRSASIHYHFPTKGDLGAAVANDYTERFRQRLEALTAESDNALVLLRGYVELFRELIESKKTMCLCGMLGAEMDSLTDQVQRATRQFFLLHRQWLEELFSRGLRNGTISYDGSAQSQSLLLLSTLEGALMLARASSDVSVFDEALNAVLNRYHPHPKVTSIAG